MTAKDSEQSDMLPFPLPERTRFILRRLLPWLLLCAGLGGIFFWCFDVAIVRHILPFARYRDTLSAGLGGTILVSAEAAVVLALMVVRGVRGRLGRLGVVLLLACLSSIGAYVINAEALKVIFGVPTPSDVLGGAGHAFHFLNGTRDSSFPSGHMTLAGAFAGVFMRVYRQCRQPMAALLAFAALLLVLGGWHFASDVIVGAGFGLAVGATLGEIWLYDAPPRRIG